MKLISLALRNFKGIKKFDLSLPDGQDTTILGNNGTGKTTVADAYYWLLTDKDSLGNATFDIKTIEKSGEPVHGVEHTVHGVFDLGGKHLELTKVFREVWTKKRGSAKTEFTGHKTEHFVNGVPVKKTEYAAKMKAIADPGTFKLLTSPAYFPEILHWEKRREIVLQVCGDISDGEVIARDDALYGLPAILGDCGHDDHKKAVKAAQAKINKELTKIETRVDENQLIIDKAGEIDLIPEGELKGNIAALSALRKKQTRIENGGQIAELKKDLAGIEQQIIKIENVHLASVAEQTDKFRSGMVSAEKVVNNLLLRSVSLDGQSEISREQIQDNMDSMDLFRDRWDTINNREFLDSGDCPTCGQALPVAEVKEAKSQFNINKSEDLAEITKKGVILKEKNESFGKNIEDNEAKIKALNIQIEEHQAISRTAQEQIAEIEKVEPDYGDLKKKAEDNNKSIRELSKGSSEELAEIKAEISTLETIINRLHANEESRKTVTKSKNRIAELKIRERELATEYERLESELFLLEQFVRTKAGLLESRINSVFAPVRFRLFKEQINEGLTDCCDVLGSDGVSYSSGLNSGARTNIGLSCINVLGKYYGQSFPVFCDNSESVTELEKIDAQMIKLIVSKDDQTLRIEGGK